MDATTPLAEPQKADIPKIPIVLGVFGHNNLADADILGPKIVGVFATLKHRYPHSPLRLLTLLTPGADQLAVEVLLESALPVEIVAPLPLPLEVYADSKDFVEHEPARQNLSLWQDKIRHFVLPMPDSPRPEEIDKWRAWAQDPRKSQECFANASAYIARQAFALLVLWDGSQQGKEIGTAEMVRLKLTGRYPSSFLFELPNDDVQTGPVYHFDALRKHEPHAEEFMPGRLHVLTCLTQDKLDGPSEKQREWNTDAVSRWLRHFARTVGLGFLLATPDARTLPWRQYLELGQTIDDFNHDVASRLETNFFDGRLKATKKETDPWQWVNRGLVDEKMRPLILLRAIAAELAGIFGTYSERLQRVFFGLIFVGLSFHMLLEFCDYLPDPVDCYWWSLFLFYVFLVLAGVVFFASPVLKILERKQDYRALSEALRVRIIWGAVGIDESVADSYLSQLKGEISWARRALYNTAPPPGYWKWFFDNLSMEQKLNALRQVTKTWVDAQAVYYAKSSGTNDRNARNYRLRGGILAIFGWILFLANFWLISNLPARAGISFYSGFLVLTGGLYVAYGERQSFEELAKQYERMLSVFEEGGDALHEHLDAATAAHRSNDDATAARHIRCAQDVLWDLGQEALTEHSQWLILRRGRPIEMVIH